ncbi:hypothetical protein [uncultured Brevundimonas sp.]|uniref:hypothetical protein n=1 Tax=uncultured Brevundimonas sp. TaxID=213418 RepID=UPI0026238809|nr:hypothetical protein [uncultured Brevundimonas sp.]
MATARTRKHRARVWAAAEARRLAKRAAEQDAKRLRATGAEADVLMARDEKGKVTYITRARRIDVFQLLLERDGISLDAFNAVRAYEQDVATAAGANTPERRPDHIRASTEGAPGQNIGQQQIEASKRVQFVDDRLPPRDLKLLTALLHEGAAYLQQWRATVQAVTGERNEAAQTARVRAMAENVADIRRMKRKEAA